MTLPEAGERQRLVAKPLELGKDKLQALQTELDKITGDMDKMSKGRTNRMTVSRKVSFDSAHYLPLYSGKCSRDHGHHWELELEVSAPFDHAMGMMVDFHILDTILEKVVVDRLDHSNLNSKLVMPTAENLLIYVLGLLTEWYSYDIKPLIRCKDVDLKGQSITIESLTIWETENSKASVRF